MQEHLKQIAARIRDLREIAGLTPSALATEFKIPEETYLAYESGAMDIPVSFLYEIAARFGVELAAILTGENPRLHVYSVVRAGKGLSVERRKEYKYQSLAYNFIHKKAEPFLVTVNPDPADTPIHKNSHPGQEFNFLLEGEMEVTVGGHEIVLQPGDALYFDSGYEHGMKALGDKPARFLALIL
jgi:mannose-6-phosphate isomerase-like protein (cupin superfamily)